MLWMIFRLVSMHWKQLEAYRELQSMEGLTPVKESIDNLLTLVHRNATKEEQERPCPGIVLNRYV